ncbi:MAG: hypothetical protein WEB88_02605, partial [Gemmatimonadota bacterium]
RVSRALEALERQHRRSGGAAPGPYIASQGRYKFDRLVPWEVEARAREAVDPSLSPSSGVDRKGAAR